MSEQSLSAEVSQQRRSRATLLAIIAVAVMPVLLAYVVFFTGLGVPDHTVNKGTLVEATSLEALLSQSDFDSLSSDKKWRLLVPMDEQCNQACQDNFYATRQVHIRLGEKGLRVERVGLNVGGSEGEAALQALKAEHPKLRLMNTDIATWQAWSTFVPDEILSNVDGHFYFLVDQEGFAMMVYTNQHGNDLLKDIKRALKYSIDYQQ